MKYLPGPSRLTLQNEFDVSVTPRSGKRFSDVHTSLFVLCRLTVEWDTDHRDCADLRGGGRLFAASCDAYGPWTCKGLLTGEFSATCCNTEK